MMLCDVARITAKTAPRNRKIKARLRLLASSATGDPNAFKYPACMENAVKSIATVRKPAILDKNPGSPSALVKVTSSTTTCNAREMTAMTA